MADTPAAPNNKAVTFRGKPEREAVTAPHAGAKKLTPRVRKNAKRAIKRGMISEKAAKRHLGDV